MLEYPEIKTIAEQMNTVLPGKTIQQVDFPGLERKFVFSNQAEEEFNQRLVGQTIVTITPVGNHLFIATSGGAVLNIGDTGGKLLYHADQSSVPARYDLKVSFSDGSSLTLSVQMWGFIAAVSAEEAAQHQASILEEARDPLSEHVTPTAFLRWLQAWEEAPKISAKKWIISRKYVTGLGNGYVQEIMFRAGIHPRRKMNTLSDAEATRLLTAVQSTVRDALTNGGRNAEFDLFGNRGRFATALNKDTVNQPCPNCGSFIEKFSFEGGACYICPVCQPLEPAQH
ncbi:MAG: hypothetical protein HPY85_14675 [Anaerolineae bacterium]|nr:hypothetical protein [Anaerolineae bacterium]